jgi:hypothetical protein
LNINEIIKFCAVKGVYYILGEETAGKFLKVFQR